MLSRIIFVGGGLFLGIISTAISGDHRQRLLEIQQQIRTLESAIQVDLNQQKETQQKLKKQDLSIEQLNRRLINHQQQLKEKNRELMELRHREQAAQGSFEQHKTAGQKALLRHYLTLRGARGCPERERFLVRANVYMGYLMEFRRRDLTSLVDQWMDTREGVETLDLIKNNTAKRLDKQQQSHTLLKRQKEQQKAKLARLDRELQAKKKKLALLLANKKNLEQLITQLVEQRVGEPSEKRRVFTWVWPITNGKVVTKFGSPIEDSAWLTNNLVLRTNHPEVRAIAEGKVIYAGSLKGYGMLLILEHENAYISLYGYNEILYKRLGERVRLGEVVSKLDLQKDGMGDLYFAIRREEKALDPERLDGLKR